MKDVKAITEKHLKALAAELGQLEGVDRHHFVTLMHGEAMALMFTLLTDIQTPPGGLLASMMGASFNAASTKINDYLKARETMKERN